LARSEEDVNFLIEKFPYQIWYYEIDILTPVIVLLILGTNLGAAQQSAYNLTVIVTSHSFGMDSVSIDIQTENGYSQNQQVATAGAASWTFSIPPNQGGWVQVCW